MKVFDSVFTIGHSTRPITDFIALLEESKIKLVVDVRSIPRSRAMPQFNSDSLAESLARGSIDYLHLASLGGRRHHKKGTPPSPNTLWRVAAFRNYSDYAATDDFRAGLEELIAFASRQRCAIMCAEAVWWRCHRRIIADYLIARGIPVNHIMSRGNVMPATLTPGAAITKEETILYPESGACF